MKIWSRAFSRTIILLMVATGASAQQRLVPERKAGARLVCTGDGDIQCSYIQPEKAPASTSVPFVPEKKVHASEAKAPEVPPIDETRPVTQVAVRPVKTTLSTRTEPVESQTTGRDEELLVSMRINGHGTDEYVRLLRHAGHYFASSELFAERGLRLPQIAPFHALGKDYFPLETGGVACYFNSSEQVLNVVVPAASYSGSVVDLSSRRSLEPLPVQPGLFINHDFQLNYTNDRLGASGLVETGFFSSLGVFTNRMIQRDLASPTAPLRLDSSLFRDFPSRMATLTIGDAVSSSSAWGRSVYYGGIRWSRKFATQPEFRPLALPSMNGEAAQPSTVDIYVNSIRMSQQNVDAGPFSIRNVPAMTGQGNVTMVVTDMLGRQQVISQSYIAAQELLRRGISDYAYDAGVLRYGYGTSSTSYSGLFGSGSYRRGVSDNFTFNLHGEGMGRVQAAGFGADTSWLPLGVVSFGAAVSNSSSGPGGLVYSQLNHRARMFGAGASVQATTAGFRQLGLASDELPKKLTVQAQVSRALRTASSLSFGYLLRKEHQGLYHAMGIYTRPDFSAVTASFNTRVLQRATLTISTNYSPSTNQGLLAAVSLVIPLGGRTSITATSDLNGDSSSGMVEYNRQLPVNHGYGYRVRQSLGNSRRADVGFSFQNDVGTYGVEAGYDHGQTSWRLSEAGGVAFMNRHVMLSRHLDDSFAIVEVENGKGVGVYANNQFVTKTSNRGLALIPRLASYEPNVIRLDDEGLPLDVSTDFGERPIVPSPRSGVLVRYKFARITGALLVLSRESGMAVPVGAEVSVNNDPATFQTAKGGEVYIPQLTFPARIHARWHNENCDAVVIAPANNQPLPRIGPIVCKDRK